jgi:group I intron endonuclease
MQDYIIYKLTFKNNKSYIGLTNDLNGRIYEHCRSAKLEKQYKISRAVRKYGLFSVEILENNLTADEAKIAEVEFISSYNTYKTGYNMTLGGDGVCGYVFTDKDRAKVAAGVSKYVRTEEGRLQRSDTMKAILKKNNWTKGQIRPWKSKKIECVTTGKVFNSQLECAKVCNIEKGYLWRCIKANKPAKGNLYRIYCGTI